MTKAQLIDKVSGTAGNGVSKKQIGEIVDSAFDEVSKAIRKDKRFSYPGFGTFKVTVRKARTGVNPQTGEKIKIKRSKSVNFKPSPKFKESL